MSRSLALLDVVVASCPMEDFFTTSSSATQLLHLKVLQHSTSRSESSGDRAEPREGSGGFVAAFHGNERYGGPGND